MIREKTDLKCLGCKRDLPKDGYNVETGRASWYGSYRGNMLAEWVCDTCWDKGVRYTEGTVTYLKDMK